MFFIIWCYTALFSTYLTPNLFIYVTKTIIWSVNSDFFIHRKRSKNNEAVKKSREKSKQKIQEKKARVMERTEENNQLRQDIRAISKLNKDCKDLVLSTAGETSCFMG